MEKNKRKRIRRLIKGVLLLCPLSLLTACQVVEPEKRAYPQVIGIDWQEQQAYDIWMHLAVLTEDTGQGKESSETQPGNDLYFSGATTEAIMADYEASREQYLDIGHVKAVIFEEGLWEKEEILIPVLKKMEEESSLGNSPCVFVTEHVSELARTVQEQKISLGDFLTGFYENRTDDAQGTPVKLADLYRAVHKKEKFSQVPKIVTEGQQLKIRIPGTEN